MKIKTWGQTLSMDLSGCPKKHLTNPKKLGKYCLDLCAEIKMEPEGKPLVKRFGEGALEGYSAVQFIKTSCITVHADEYDDRVFIDVFSCKKFDPKIAMTFTKKIFEPKKLKSRNYYRS